MVRMMGINQGKKYMVFCHNASKHLKNILNERKKYHKRLIQLELNFLLREQRMQEINKNDAVIVLVFFFFIFSIAMYPSVWLEAMSRREIVSYRFLGIQWILLSMQNSFFSKAQKGKILETLLNSYMARSIHVKLQLQQIFLSYRYFVFQ